MHPTIVLTGASRGLGAATARQLARFNANLVLNIGPYLLIRAALPSLRERQGRVINISSGAASYATAGWSAYSASKAALNQLSETVAIEEPTITSLAVRPGKVDTDMQATVRRAGAKGMTKRDHQRFVGYYEQGELMAPELPALSLAVLSLSAPHDWSGRFINWNDPEVQALMEKILASTT